MRLARCIALSALALAMACGAARAQDSELEAQPPAEPLTRCLTRSIAEPSFPAEATDSGAVVRVNLTFKAADVPPEVEVTYDDGKPTFVAEVRRFLAGYRLPCLPAGQQVAARQEFQFVQQKPLVLRGEVQEPDEKLPEGCNAVVAKWDKPYFPVRHSGNVLAKFIFRSAEAPPEVRILYNGGHDRLARAVVLTAEDFRLSCAGLTYPFMATRIYAFRVQDEPAPQLKDKLTLTQLLGLVRPADRNGVRFDFRTMKCPFRLEVAPQMPHVHNRVRQLSEPSDDRMEFIAWLRRVQFQIPSATMPTMFGSPTTVDVPCAVLDLT